MSVSGLPFDDIRDLISALPPIDERAVNLAVERNTALQECFGFGEHESLVCKWMAGWSGKSPAVQRPLMALFAGTHRVNGYAGHIPGESTLASVTRMAAGGAPVNQVCAANDIGLKVFDLALQFPVGDITRGEALDEKGSAATIGFGMEAIAGGVDLLGLAAFGQGSEVANLAILSLLSKSDPQSLLALFPKGCSDWCLEPAKQAVELHKAASNEPLEILRRLGGREHSALVGAILAARVNHVPVVLDGISAISVAALLNAIDPDTLKHCLFATNAGEAIVQGAPDKTPVYAMPERPAAILNGFAPCADGSSAGHAIAVLKSIAATHTNTVLEEA